MNRIIFQLFFTLLLSALFVSCSRQGPQPEPVSIVPLPMEMELTGEVFTLKASTVIDVPVGEECRHIGEYLSGRIRFLSGLDLVITENSGNKRNRITLTTGNNEQLGEEGYTLTVTKSGIILEAFKPHGLFNGVQTLAQLLPLQNDSNLPVGIPGVKITDQPRYRWRGMHLDVSRHFFPKEFIKKYIDLLAVYRMNTFHWHLTDDNGWRIEIKKYPELTDIAAWRVDRENLPWDERPLPSGDEKATYGGFYTQEDIREIIDYAAKRYITIIPEIEMPGHSSEVFAAFPELSCNMKRLPVQPGGYWPNSDIFCAGREETFRFLEDVLSEVMELFPSQYIHIGGDEADKTNWKKCQDCQARMKAEKLSDESQLQSYFIKRIEKFVTSKGKNIIGWDEILEGGLAPNAVVMSWRGLEGGIAAARERHDVIMCPTSYCYLDYYQADPEFEPKAIGGLVTLKKVYSFEPTPEQLTPEEAKHILGVQGNLWTEYIATPGYAEYMAVPRMIALAEVGWSKKEAREWNGFNFRMQKQFRLLDRMGVNYSKGSWKADIRPFTSGDPGFFHVVLETEQYGAKIHFTLDGTDPLPTSPEYRDPISIEKTTTVKAAVFDNGKLMEKISAKTIHIHRGIGKKGNLKEPPSERYKGSGELSLLDGMKGSTNFRDGYWLGFDGKDMEFVVDLDTGTSISRVTVSFLQQAAAWIFLPVEVEISVLGGDLKPIQSKLLKPLNKPDNKMIITEDFTAEFGKPEGRYIRVIARSMKTCPAWHEGAGNPCWIFTDEVIIE